MSGTHVIFVFAFFLPLLVQGQFSSNCESKETCRECIQEVGCAWCITPVRTFFVIILCVIFLSCIFFLA